MIEAAHYRGYVIEVHQDENAENPCTEFENMGTMVCWHKRYSLGNEHTYADPDDFIYELAKEVDDTIADRVAYWEERDCQSRIDSIIEKALHEHCLILPLFLYDHSGLSMSVQTFTGRAQHAGWDSGQVGYIYITHEKILKEYGWKRITKARRERIESLLKAEVREYSAWLEGNVYGYITKDYDDNEIDSYWGFYSGTQHLFETAKLEIDNHIIQVKEDKEQLVTAQNEERERWREYYNGSFMELEHSVNATYEMVDTFMHIGETVKTILNDWEINQGTVGHTITIIARLERLLADGQNRLIDVRESIEAPGEATYSK